uniref:Uncharacterized protein n=1 Tax=Peronospora matthiolae TaxID=2874970 RepID=A0AAV1VK49_9STRA
MQHPPERLDLLLVRLEALDVLLRFAQSTSADAFVLVLCSAACGAQCLNKEQPATRVIQAK